MSRYNGYLLNVVKPCTQPLCELAQFSWIMETLNCSVMSRRLADRATEYVIEPTKTNAGTRVIPMTKEVTEMFRAIIQDRPEYKVEKVVGGYTGFLFLDKNGMPMVAMHWEHRFNSMVMSRRLADRATEYVIEPDRKSTRLNSSHNVISRMPSSA